MTDNEIIKALECHSNDFSFCMMCPFTNREECSCELSKNALDLINRQKAEIERLNNTIYTFEKHFEFVKAEAVRKFAERFEAILATYECTFIEIQNWSARNTILQVIQELRNLVKEMVGEQRKEDEGK